MNGRGKFDKYSEFWRDIERAGRHLFRAEGPRAHRPVARERSAGIGGDHPRTVPPALPEVRPQAGGDHLPRRAHRPLHRLRRVWLDPGELESLAPEAHTSWLGELLSRMTGRVDDSR
jgi:hypothetical protein